MGRIEDALQKLQARNARRAGDAPQSAPPAQLARVAAEALPDHQYGGKRIEVDSVALRANGLLAEDAEERRLADEYRVIKRPLIRNAAADQDPVAWGNLLMVASARPGEGKTFTCLNLCLSIARERDWSVVLVDGDCAKPHLSQLFGAERELGLLDLLRDPDRPFASLVMPTNVPRLSFLPAGGRDVHAAELLASVRMQSLCAEISQEDPQRLVVFDSPPLLYTTEAPVLASHVGQIVVVVHANRTPQHAVTAALAKLDPTKAINLILNQTGTVDESALHGDYYGYGGQSAAAQ